MRGREIRSVTFTLDGRQVKRTRAVKGRLATYRLVERRLAFGQHTLRIRATFSAASGARARTLTRTFFRCRSVQSANPRFTG